MKFASLDLFTKTKEDIDTSSAWGGLYTLLAILLGIILFLTEFSEYMDKEWSKEMKIENILAHEVQVNIDISFQNTPCHLIVLDKEDDSGNHKGEVPITKLRTWQNQSVIRDAIPTDADAAFNSLVEAINTGERCRFYGNFSIPASPGNFHVSFHSKLVMYMKLSQEQRNKVNMAFTINHLSFGTTQDQNNIRSRYFPNRVDFSPYRKLTFVPEGKTRIDYFLKLVPNRFIIEDQMVDLQAFQYSLNSKETPTENEAPPALYFTYEVNPITIAYTLQHHPFSHFLVQICAIVGGIFSVMGILNSLTIESINFLRKRS